MTGWDVAPDSEGLPLLLAEIRLELPYPPSANEYWRNVQGRVLVSKVAREYRADVDRICFAKGMLPLRGDVFMSILVYRPQKSGDVSNRIKVLEDALRGWAFIDDKQVEELRIKRIDGGKPRACVYIAGHDGFYTKDEVRRIAAEKVAAAKKRKAKKAAPAIGRHVAIPAITQYRRRP